MLQIDVFHRYHRNQLPAIRSLRQIRRRLDIDLHNFSSLILVDYLAQLVLLFPMPFLTPFKIDCY